MGAARADFIFRDRRGALHFGVGARGSSGIQAVEPAAAAFSGAADRGVYGQRDAARAAGYSRAIAIARTGEIYREFSPAEFAVHREGVRERDAGWAAFAGAPKL